MKLPQLRAPGAPTGAIPALAGFTFVCLIAPVFYAGFIAIVLINNPDKIADSITYWLAGIALWIFGSIFATIYPAIRGKIWAIKAMRFISVLGLLALVCAVLGDLIYEFKQAGGQSGFAEFLFWCPLAPLMVAAGFLVDGLLHQPWFDPAASPHDIGPSRGTIGDLERQAGLDSSGRLPPEKLAAAFHAPPPPPRWLCYVAPPIAAIRMRKLWHAALFAPVCLAALVLIVVIPLRALFVYGLMGSFADRLRAIAAYRRIVAQRQEPLPPLPKRRTSRNIKPPA